MRRAVLALLVAMLLAWLLVERQPEPEFNPLDYSDWTEGDRK